LNLANDEEASTTTTIRTLLHLRPPQGAESSPVTGEDGVSKIPLRNFTKVASFLPDGAHSLLSSSSNVVDVTAGISSNPSLPQIRRPFSLKLSKVTPNPFKEGYISTTPFLLPSASSTSSTSTSSLLDEFNQTANETVKTIKILDKLRSLTNLRLQAKSRLVNSNGKGFRLKSFGKHNVENSNSSSLPSSSSEESTPQTSNNNENNPNDTVSISTESSSSSTSPSIQVSKIAGHLLQTSSSAPLPLRPPPSLDKFFRSTTPIVLKQADEKRLNASLEEGLEETRVAITADQLAGGNRPTKTPFHFTSAAPTESTTLGRVQINRYKKPYSPHNHAYAPTQDPVQSIENEEDLSVEDYHDIRRANQAFGFKVVFLKTLNFA